MARIINIRQLQRIVKKVGRKHLHMEPSVKERPEDRHSTWWCVTDYFNQETYHINKYDVSRDQVMRCCGYENIYDGQGNLEERRIEHLTPLTRNLRKAAYCGWYCLRSSTRRFLVSHGIDKTHVDDMHKRNGDRLLSKLHAAKRNRFQIAREIVKYFSEIPYEYQGDGLDDFNKYQRPCSNGIGWVAICPGERGNNYYTDDPFAVKILRRKYDAYCAAHPNFKPQN